MDNPYCLFIDNVSQSPYANANDSRFVSLSASADGGSIERPSRPQRTKAERTLLPDAVRADESGSYQHQQDPSQSSGDGLDEGRLVSAHGIWQQGPFSLRALWAQWTFDGTAVALADVDKQTGWYIEPSVKFTLGGNPLGVYTRYEDLDGARTRDRVEQWELGLNYWPTDNVVLKADYRNRDHTENIDTGRDFKGIDLGLGYHF